jgi:hypothetical protein
MCLKFLAIGKSAFLIFFLEITNPSDLFLSLKKLKEISTHLTQFAKVYHFK